MHRSEVFVEIIGLIADNKRWRHLQPDDPTSEQGRVVRLAIRIENQAFSNYQPSFGY